MYEWEVEIAFLLHLYNKSYKISKIKSQNTLNFIKKNKNKNKKKTLRRENAACMEKSFSELPYVLSNQDLIF